jgi:hypothetical protein
VDQEYLAREGKTMATTAHKSALFLLVVADRQCQMGVIARVWATLIASFQNAHRVNGDVTMLRNFQRSKSFTQKRHANVCKSATRKSSNTSHYQTHPVIHCYTVSN